jgi:hypothetical protein
MKQLLLALLLSLFQATSLFAADKMRVAFASFGRGAESRLGYFR